MKDTVSHQSSAQIPFLSCSAAIFAVWIRERERPAKKPWGQMTASKIMMFTTHVE